MGRLMCPPRRDVTYSRCVRDRRTTRGRAGIIAATVVALVLPLSAAPLAHAVTSDSPSVPPSPTSTHSTAPPKDATWVTVRVSPASGSVLGVATTITAVFTSAVQRKATAERHMKVYANSTLVDGAWYWKSDYRAVFRPKIMWPGHVKVSVRLSLSNVTLAESSTRVWVGTATSNRTHSFSIGRRLIAKVIDSQHRMYVYIDGTRVRTIPVSLGKPGFITRSGVKAVMEKYLQRTMTSQALGITDPADQYEVTAPYAVRITTSGEFVHGAPWANYRIGRFNGSHGCTNVFLSDSRWFYDTVLPGDPVITSGTGRAMEPWNGTGGPWNIPWSTWLLHSAAKGQTP